MNTIYIKHLPLPIALTEAIRNGQWRTPTDRSVWTTLFPPDEIVQPVLYNLSSSTGIWLPEAGPAYFGKKGEGCFPGDIDPERTIVIGDLGPDRLIALDYRLSDLSPSVIGLTSEDHSNWKLIAKNIETFMRAIRVID